MLQPISELEKQRDLLAAFKKRKLVEIEEIETKNKQLRDRLIKEQADREAENEQDRGRLSVQQ